jgi:threonine/homoserine/homoserine lactone efflux protein
LLGFVITAVGISLSGVLAPGPITAATLAAGTRHRHAGFQIALGHIAVELPGILLLFVGLGAFLNSSGVRAGIGLAGGAFLLLMGVQLLMSLRASQNDAEAPAERHPFWTGSLLTVTSPYFWIWSATVGLTLTTQALEISLLALALLASVHWLCDLGWMEVLSLAGFKGSQVFGRRGQQFVSAFCAVMLLGFGLKFIYDAGIGLLPNH